MLKFLCTCGMPSRWACRVSSSARKVHNSAHRCARRSSFGCAYGQSGRQHWPANLQHSMGPKRSQLADSSKSRQDVNDDDDEDDDDDDIDDDHHHYVDAEADAAADDDADDVHDDTLPLATSLLFSHHLIPSFSLHSRVLCLCISRSRMALLALSLLQLTLTLTMRTHSPFSHPSPCPCPSLPPALAPSLPPFSLTRFRSHSLAPRSCSDVCVSTRLRGHWCSMGAEAPDIAGAHSELASRTSLALHEMQRSPR